MKKQSSPIIDPAIMPNPDSPGFALASPRVYQVWLALLHHAQKFAHGEGEIPWTVDQLATACGCNRNTAGAALKELVELGWVKTSTARHVGGEYGGFRFRMLPPPETLPASAKRHLQERVHQSKQRVMEKERRLLSEELRTASVENKKLRTDLQKKLARVEELLEQHIAKGK